MPHHLAGRFLNHEIPDGEIVDGFQNSGNPSSCKVTARCFTEALLGQPPGYMVTGWAGDPAAIRPDILKIDHAKTAMLINGGGEFKSRLVAPDQRIFPEHDDKRCMNRFFRRIVNQPDSFLPQNIFMHFLKIDVVVMTVHGNGDIEEGHPVSDAFQLVLPVDEHDSAISNGYDVEAWGKRRMIHEILIRDTKI